VIGDGIRRRRQAPELADADRDDFRCRAGLRDTIEPLVGRGEGAADAPDCTTRTYLRARTTQEAGACRIDKASDLIYQN
jgi:hypothetical protein